MVDIHNHLLPGLDDGAPDLATSLEMARLAVADGITHMVCTPHASAAFAYSPERVLAEAEALRHALQASGIPLALGTGCDFHLSYDNVQDALASPRKYTVNNGEHLLIELPDHTLPPAFEQTLYDLRLAGMTPILTHPERNSVLQRDPSRLAPWVEGGLLVQVTAASVMGKMGPQAEKIGKQLLRKRLVHFLASDAHNVSKRPPGLSAARQWVATRCDAAYAELITLKNPQAVFASEPLPPQPFLGDEDDFEQRSPWWKRFFAR